MKVPTSIQENTSHNDGYLKHLRHLYWQRVSNFPQTLFLSAILVWLFIWLATTVTHFIAGNPHIPPDIGDAFTFWHEKAELRDNLRDSLLQFTAGILALLGLTSLAQVPAANSDIEQHVRHRVSQDVGLISAVGLACYAWLSVPFSESEMNNTNAWHGVLVLFMASGLATLIGPDKNQRVTNLVHIQSRTARIQERRHRVETHLSNRSPKERTKLSFKGWITKEWRDSVQNEGFHDSYGKKPTLRQRRLPTLWPVRSFILLAISLGGWAYLQELALGQELASAWRMPLALAISLFLTAAATIPMHYRQAWNAMIGSKWQFFPAILFDFMMILFSLTFAVAGSRGSLAYAAGNIVCVLLAATWPLIRHRKRRDKMLELERRSLVRKENHALTRWGILEDLETANRSGSYS